MILAQITLFSACQHSNQLQPSQSLNKKKFIRRAVSQQSFDLIISLFVIKTLSVLGEEEREEEASTGSFNDGKGGAS